jgi:SAM-dependent methyltransferase
MRNYDQEAKNHPDHAYAYQYDWIIRRFLLRNIEPFLNTKGRTLELGCYQGDMTAQIINYVSDLTVIEASAELCNLVKERFGSQIHIIHSTFEEADLPIGHFDTIFLIHTLEHNEYPIALLKRIKQWLSAQGRLIVAVPNGYALSRQIAVAMGLIDSPLCVTKAEQAHGHFRTYSDDMLRYELKSAGYHIEHYSGILLKALANFQFDQALANGTLSPEYIDATYEVGLKYPDLCASIVMVARSGQ